MSDGGLHPLPRPFNAVSQLLITVAAASLKCQCLFSNFPGPHEVVDASIRYSTAKSKLPARRFL